MATTSTGDVAANLSSDTAEEKPATAIVEPPAQGEKALKPDSKLEELFRSAKASSHPEIWGVVLADPATHVPSQIVFQKYLNANDGDLVKAKDQLKKTLEWRAKNKPLELIKDSYSKEKFGGLGYITSYTDSTSSGVEGKEVFTWNVYGVVKDFGKTFDDMDAFIDWRVALMEMAMHELDIGSATLPITAENDPYKLYQIHDYKSISFFRSPPAVRAAAKKTVEVLALAYPETLREKFFINVPAVMGFMYGVMKLFVAPKTIKKFHPMSNGGALAAEFGDSKVKGLGEKLPKEYGGTGADLSVTGREPLLV